MYPDDLKYTKEHEWARAEPDGIRVGITHYAQDSLGDIVYVDIPGPGTAVTAGQAFGEVESTKSVSDLFAPVSGTIVERNASLDDAPELVNQDAYGKGWLVLIKPEGEEPLGGLMAASEYQGFLETSS